MSLDPSAGDGFVGLVMPSCNVPLYQMDSIDTAKRCGHYNGLIDAGLLAVASIIVAAIYTYYVHQQTMKSTVYKPPIPVIAAWVIAVLVAGAGLLGIPRLLAYTQGQKWKGYQVQIGSLVSQGMTRTQAVTELGRTARAQLSYAGQNAIADAISTRSFSQNAF
jgi:hypothetical protein